MLRGVMDSSQRWYGRCVALHHITLPHYGACPHEGSHLSLHIVRALKPGARAAVVVPDNVLFEDNVGRRLRTWMMELCGLHTILRLPTGIFYAQGVKTNVLFYTRGKTDRTKTDNVWVYDLRANMPAFGKTRPLAKGDFAAFEAAYGDDPCGKARRKDQVRTYLKNIAIVPESLNGSLTSTGIAVLRPTEAVESQYLFRWVGSEPFVSSMSQAQDGTMYPAFTDRDVYAGRVHLPPVQEQRRIVAKLDGFSLQQMAEAQHRGLIGHRHFPKVDARKPAHRYRVVEGFLHPRIREIEPLL